MFDIVFHTPEIPPNTGNAMRLAAVTGCRLHLIEPLGFDMEDTKLRRAGMDYRDKATVTVHPDVETWRRVTEPGRVFAFTVDGDGLYTEERYREGDALVFGLSDLSVNSKLNCIHGEAPSQSGQSIKAPPQTGVVIPLCDTGFHRPHHLELRSQTTCAPSARAHRGGHFLPEL